MTGYGQQSEVRKLASFTGVKAAEAVDVYLKKGEKESVRVEASGTSLSNVITEVDGSYLRIHMREGSYRDRNVKAYVTYVTLEKISCSSAANIFSEGTIKVSSMDISVSSAGTIELSLDAGVVRADASSAGDIVLEGKTKSLEVGASSAGEVDAYNLESEVVYARAASGGSAKVHATRELTATASSGGDVRFHGNPMKTNTNSSSGGTVIKSN